MLTLLQDNISIVHDMTNRERKVTVKLLVHLLITNKMVLT